MYKVNKGDNNIEEVKKITFKTAGFKERQHLQEWIAKNPSCLGEELLIIQKEFSGFDDTKERLDLLALDKKGNLVIIENKLDDSGRDVVWQALKYVSYCSSLSANDIEQIYSDYLSSNNEIKNAKESLIDFFGDEDYGEVLNIGYSQRTILVSGEYRKEVTSTALWLLNNGIDVTCFKATPYSFKEDVLIDFKQIIPLEDAEEYIIKIASKQKEEVLNKRVRGSRFEVRKTFWKKFLEMASQKSNLTQNLSPTTDAWIGVALGMSGVSISLVVAKNYARCEVYINRGEQSLNKKTFDILYENKKEIEDGVGVNLEWERMNDKVTSRIKWQKNNVNIYNDEDHEEMINFLIESMIKMQSVFKKQVQNIKR